MTYQKVRKVCCKLKQSHSLIVCKVVNDLANFSVDQTRVCVCSVCMFLASNSSETVEVIIIKRGTVIASDMLVCLVLIILTFTFIQGHTDPHHENNKCLIVAETIQAMPIKFAVKIVRLKVYMAIAVQ